MYFELFLAATLMTIGGVIFGHFEEKTPVWRRLTKVAIFLGVTALLSSTVGRPWSLVWIFGALAVGTTFHVWCTKKHVICVLSPQPRDKYYQLRGWS